MFFNAHIYYSKQRAGDDIYPMRALGAILADSALTGVIGWTDLHDRKVIDRFAAVLGKDKLGGEMIQGLRDHYDLDIKSHDVYDNGPGYAFSHQTPRLVEVVAKACRLNDLEKAKGIAHNFIESGVDLNLLRHYPDIQDQGRRAMEEADQDYASSQIANFFDLDIHQTTQRLAQFVKLTLKYDLNKVDEWALFWAEIIGLLLSADADMGAIKEGLVLAIDLTKSDYLDVISD